MLVATGPLAPKPHLQPGFQQGARGLQNTQPKAQGRYQTKTPDKPTPGKHSALCSCVRLMKLSLLPGAQSCPVQPPPPGEGDEAMTTTTITASVRTSHALCHSSPSPTSFTQTDAIHHLAHEKLGLKCWGLALSHCTTQPLGGQGRRHTDEMLGPCKLCCLSTQKAAIRGTGFSMAKSFSFRTSVVAK